MLSYVAISPVKDEKHHVEQTLRSMTSQTLRPSKWVVVDDGSSDGTREVLERYRRRHDWIQVVDREPGQSRQPGAPVINAFNKGLALVDYEAHDFIVKLDCDLSFDPDYFARLADRFHENPRLGIASGIYVERGANGWRPIGMPSYHAAGAAKAVRAKCFGEIGGFVAARGWDTVDEIKAWSCGWETRHFKDLVLKHWKREGSGIGRLRTGLMLGEVTYVTGGGLSFLIFKSLSRSIFGTPPLLDGALVFAGYVRAGLMRKNRLVTDAEAATYRRVLRRRATGLAAQALGRLPLLKQGLSRVSK